MAVATTSDFDTTFFIDEVIEEAFAMIGGEPELGNDGISARRSLNLLLTDWQNRGVLLWGTDLASTTLSTDTAEYTLDSDTVDVLNGYVRRSSNSNDFQLTRIAYEEYEAITDKTTSGRPTQFATLKGRDTMKAYFFPVPDSTDTYTFRHYRMKRLKDVNKSALENADVPFRFLPCLTAGLAYYLSFKRPNVPAERVTMLQANYEKLLENAMEADKERVSLFITPRLGVVQMALTQKQKQMDLNKNNRIDADDLAALRKSKETVEEMQKGGRVVLKPLMRKHG